MADAEVLYAEDLTGETITTTGSLVSPAYGTGLTLSGGSFTANEDYLVMAWGYFTSTSSAQEVAVGFLVGGTSDGDAPALFEIIATEQRVPIGFVRKVSQGATPGSIQIVAGTTGTGDVTAYSYQIMAIKLSDLGTVGTNWWLTENTTGGSTTASLASFATCDIGTPNGTDVYLLVGDISYVPGDTASNTDFDLYASVDGVLASFTQEGEDTTNEYRQQIMGMAYAPSGSAQTFQLRAAHESTSSTINRADLFVMNLSALFADVQYQRTAGSVTPATETAWDTTVTTSITPSATGQHVLLGGLTADMNSISTASDGLRVRLQLNNGGGLTSTPAYGDNAPELDSWDATDQSPMFIGARASISTGAARTVNLDVQQQGTAVAVQERWVVVFPVTLAGGGAIALAGAATGSSSGAGVLTTQIKLAGTADGLSSGAGTLAGVAAALAGTADGLSSGAGILTTQIKLAGAAGGLSSGAGVLTTQVKLAGAATGTSSGAGVLTTQVKLAGAATGTSSGAGVLTGIAAALAGTATGSSSGAGVLTVPSSGSFFGTATGSSSGAGVLTTQVLLAGAATGSSSGAGVLTGVAAALAGTATGSSSGAGVLTDYEAIRIAGGYVWKSRFPGGWRRDR